jgi:sugar lactone lactonase YvrE
VCARYGAESPSSASDGRVTVFIRDSGPGAPESLAADEQGNVFGGFIEMQTLKKYVRN